MPSSVGLAPNPRLALVRCPVEPLCRAIIRLIRGPAASLVDALDLLTQINFTNPTRGYRVATISFWQATATRTSWRSGLIKAVAMGGASQF